MSEKIVQLNEEVIIGDRRNRPLQGGKYPYIYVDGIYLRRSWSGKYKNVAILVAIGKLPGASSPSSPKHSAPL